MVQPRRVRSDRVEHTPLDGTPLPGPPSRPDLPSRFGERPCAALADEIEAGNVRVLFVVGGNPVTSLPDTSRLEAAFASLDVLAVADVIAADTVRYATHVLPVAGQLEREDVTWFTDRFPPVIAAQRTDAVLPPGADRRALVDVLDDLGARIGLAPDTDLIARSSRASRSSPRPVPSWLIRHASRDGYTSASFPTAAGVSRRRRSSDSWPSGIVREPRRSSRYRGAPRDE